MAEGFARALAGGRAVVASAGSRPSGHVDARAVQCMRERGIDLTAQRSKGLADLPVVHAGTAAAPWDYIVTMGCGDACPHLPAWHRLDWDLPDPKHLDDDGVRAVRDRIEGLVRDLVAEATATPGPRETLE